MKMKKYNFIKSNIFMGSIIKIISAVLLLIMYEFSFAEGSLEVPQYYSTQSGIDQIAGWYCDANQITVRIDNGPSMYASYKRDRPDTTEICGDSNNGFVYLLNYADYGEGLHNISVYADGALFASADFYIQQTQEN